VSGEATLGGLEDTGFRVQVRRRQFRLPVPAVSPALLASRVLPALVLPVLSAIPALAAPLAGAVLSAPSKELARCPERL
jgi:hypothetical protein